MKEFYLSSRVFLEYFLIVFVLGSERLDMTIFERLKFLANKQGKSINRVEEDLNLPKNSLYSWKKAVPSGDRLELIADYFGVSVDYLLGRDSTPPVQPTVDIVELANKPKDFDWDSVLSAGGKPIPEEDKEIIRRLFAHKLSD